MNPVAILYYPEKKPWIIKTIAEKFAESLPKIGCPAEFTSTLTPKYTTIYHFNYLHCRQTTPGTKNFTYVTHVNEDWKLQLLRAQAEAGIVGICMSEDTARRMRELTKSKNFVGLTPPAMRFQPFPPLKLLFASRLYEDGRKNISVFERVLQLLSTDDVELSIIGSGWEEFIERVRPMTQKIHYTPDFSESAYLDYIAKTDLLFYGGCDEGAISVVDYLAAGKEVLATAQGYHLDFTSSDKLHLFSNNETLTEQVQLILQARQHARRIHQRLTDWDEYCRKHVEVFSGKLDF